MLIRSRNRDRSRGGSVALSSLATAYLGGVTPYHYADYITNRMLYAGADVGTVAGGTGYSFTRASDGYYENSDGTLTLFGSGALRRGDRGVLIEGSRTNLLLRSQEFDNAAWANFNSVDTANYTASPTGATNATRLIDDAGGGSGSVTIFQNGTVTTATNTTFSAFLKADQLGWAALQTSNYDASGNGTSYFNLNTGAVGTKDANHSVSGIQALGNGWYRCWIVFQSTTDVIGTVAIRVASADATAAVTRNGTSSILIFGAQLEAASFPSSYIPTVAASATRAADVLTYTAGVSYPIQLFAEFERAVDTGSFEELFNLDDGDSSDRAVLYVGTTDLASVDMRTASVSQGPATVAGTVALNTVTKLAGRFQTNDMRPARGGTLGTADTSCTLPAAPTRLVIGNAPSFGYIRRIAVIQGAGTDANLQAMTS